MKLGMFENFWKIFFKIWGVLGKYIVLLSLVEDSNIFIYFYISIIGLEVVYGWLYL